MTINPNLYEDTFGVNGANTKLKQEREEQEALEAEDNKFLDKKQSFVLYHSYLTYFERLKTDDRRGKLIMIIFQFATTGEFNETGDEVIDAFAEIIIGQLIRDKEKYLRTCKNRSHKKENSGN